MRCRYQLGSFCSRHVLKLIVNKQHYIRDTLYNAENVYLEMGRTQLYRLSHVDVHTVAQNQYTWKKMDTIHFFVMTLC